MTVTRDERCHLAVYATRSNADVHTIAPSLSHTKTSSNDAPQLTRLLYVDSIDTNEPFMTIDDVRLNLLTPHTQRSTYVLSTIDQHHAESTRAPISVRDTRRLVPMRCPVFPRTFHANLTPLESQGASGILTEPPSVTDTCRVPVRVSCLVSNLTVVPLAQSGCPQKPPDDRPRHSVALGGLRDSYYGHHSPASKRHATSSVLVTARGGPRYGVL